MAVKYKGGKRQCLSVTLLASATDDLRLSLDYPLNVVLLSWSTVAVPALRRRSPWGGKPLPQLVPKAQKQTGASWCRQCPGLLASSSFAVFASSVLGLPGGFLELELESSCSKDACS